MSLINCEKCGKEIPDNSKFCNECGCPISVEIKSSSLPTESADISKKRKNKTQWIKPWMLIIGAGILVAVVLLIVITSLPSKYKWDEIILKTALPEPSSEYGRLYTNDADDLYLTVNKVSFSEYESYVDNCVDKGFTFVVESDSSSYTAFNSEGYELDLDYHEYNEALDISLDVRVSGTIKWSNSKLAALLPVPKSNVGSIVNDYTYGYEVYIGNISKSEYDTYVSECKTNGFNLNEQIQNTAFYAENELGYELIVEYYDCGLIYIDLDVPEDVSDGEDNSNEEETEKGETKQTDTEATEKDNSSENVSNSKSITKKKAKSVVEELLEKDLEASIKITKLYFNEEKQGCYVEFKANNSTDAAAVHLTTGKIDYKSEFNYYSEEAKRLRSQTPINEQKLHECNQKILNSSYAEWSFSITVIENDNNASKNGWEKIK